MSHFARLDPAFQREKHPRRKDRIEKAIGIAGEQQSGNSTGTAIHRERAQRAHVGDPACASKAFGEDRVAYGGDWPVVLNASSYRRWVDTLDTLTTSLSPAAKRKLWAENAKRFYRLTVR